MGQHRRRANPGSRSASHRTDRTGGTREARAGRARNRQRRRAILPYRGALQADPSTRPSRARSAAFETMGALVCLADAPTAFRPASFAVAFRGARAELGGERLDRRRERARARRAKTASCFVGSRRRVSERRTHLGVRRDCPAPSSRTHLPIVVDVPRIAQRANYAELVACAAIAGGADGVILRTWVGRQGEVPRVPATLRWSDARSS